MSDREMHSDARERIFGIGLMKTGTNSLRQALEILGYKSLHGGRPETMWTVQRAIDEGSPMLSYIDPEYEAFTDILGLTYYFSLADVQYPGSRFILTVRDIEDWLDSRRRHVEKNAKLKEAGQYDGVLVEVNLDAWATEYRRHEAVVRAYFAGRPSDLLIFDVGVDGWEPLCEFLGRPLPEEPFPWQNKFEPWTAPSTGATP